MSQDVQYERLCRLTDCLLYALHSTHRYIGVGGIPVCSGIAVLNVPT